MRRLMFLLFGLSAAAASYAQCGTRNAGAFLEVRYLGNIPVDEQGRPTRSGVDSAYTVYVESASDLMAGGTAWIRGRAYSINAFAVGRDAMSPGKAKRGTAVQLAAVSGKGWQRWRLELQPLQGTKKAPAAAGANGVVLQWNRAGKTCTQVLRGITELAVMPSV